jgi:dipeptidyl aminopeptidase/acylaminoacyl peptidase
VYFLRDDRGNEVGHYHRIPFEGGDPEDVTPDLPPYASFGFLQSRDGSVQGFMAAGQDGFKAYVLENGAAPRVIYQTGRIAFGPQFSADGKIAVFHSTDHSHTMDTHLVVVDVKTGEVIAECWDGAGTSSQATAFSPIPGDYRLLGSSSTTGFGRPWIWDPLNGERRYLKLDGIPGENSPWDWSRDARRVLFNQLFQAEYQLHIYNLDEDSVVKLNHPHGVVGGYFGGEFTEENEILLTWQDPSHPSRLIALDGETGEQTRVVLQAGEVPAGRGWRSVKYTSENGREIQGWLAVPEGDGPFPTILHTHGGPTAVMTTYFAPECQAFLDHGFAFLTINYHGSTTFGKNFERSIQGNLGDLEVQDMAAAYHWLVEEGIAIPDSVLLTGGSYGGYLTLQALGRRPELWAGGMAVVAIADWVLMYEDQADTLRGVQRALFGGTPEEKPDAHRASSPITYVEQVRAPVLVIQGKNDTRCPSRQLEAYAEKLKSLGGDIDVHWFDAGHGSLAQEEQIEHTERKLRFAYRVLG